MRDYENRQHEASESFTAKLVERAEVLAKEYTFYGHRKIHALLIREGFKTSSYEVYKLLQRKKLCLPSTWRKELRDNSRALKQYLIKPQRPMELLQADITHVPVEGYGTYYVINVIDYYTKYVLASVFADRHSTDKLIEACDEALREANTLGLDTTNGTKLLTDNGPAMISKRFQKYIGTSLFRHLRTKNHHPETNGCIERYHQTLKYEEVWGAVYSNPLEAKERIEKFRQFYNTERIHQALGYLTPLEMILKWKEKITYLFVA
jgi:transposase InsO family protein